MEKNLISIIIPVYNVEKYLSCCIDSVLVQTYKNLEIFLIDDGSTDSSGQICDLYATKDNRIKVIHKKNEGLSATRNLGIKSSSGDYICFVDSDDDIANDYVEYLYQLLITNKTNMSICAYTIVSNNKKINIGEKYDNCVLSTQECLERLLCRDGFDVSAISKLYKKELFDGIEFPLNKLYEDNGTIYKLIDKCEYIAYSSKSKYNYYMRSNSITTSAFNERKLDILEMTDKMCDYIEKKYPTIVDSVNKKRLEVRFSILRQISESSNPNLQIKDEIIDYIKRNGNYVKNNKRLTLKDKVAYFTLKINYNLYKITWKIYKKMRYGD